MKKLVMAGMVLVTVVGLVIYLQNSRTAQAQQVTQKSISTQPTTPATQLSLAELAKKVKANTDAIAEAVIVNRRERINAIDDVKNMVGDNIRGIVTNAKVIKINADGIAGLYNTTEANAEAIAANAITLASNTTTIGVIVAKTEADAEAIAANGEILRDHESRITNAQKSANRALGVTLRMATGMSAEDAKTKVNAFVVGDLNLGRLAVLAQKVPKGIQKAQTVADTAQTTATTGLELLRNHGSKKGWFSIHDKKLVKAAEEALTKK